MRQNTGKEKKIRVNEEINVDKVRLIDNEGAQVGIVSINDAIRMANEANIDVVEISPRETPPVCKLMDYGKYKYQESKKRQKFKIGKKQTDTKEIKFRLSIGSGDYQTKLRNAIRFLGDKDNVKAVLTLRGRENSKKELAKETMQKFLTDLTEHADIDKDMNFEGNRLMVILKPKNTNKKAPKTNDDNQKEIY